MQPTALKTGNLVRARHDLDVFWEGDGSEPFATLPAGKRGRIRERRRGELGVKFPGFRHVIWVPADAVT